MSPNPSKTALVTSQKFRTGLWTGFGLPDEAPDFITEASAEETGDAGVARGETAELPFPGAAVTEEEELGMVFPITRTDLADFPGALKWRLPPCTPAPASDTMIRILNQRLKWKGKRIPRLFAQENRIISPMLA